MTKTRSAHNANPEGKREQMKQHYPGNPEPKRPITRDKLMQLMEEPKELCTVDSVYQPKLYPYCGDWNGSSYERVANFIEGKPTSWTCSSLCKLQNIACRPIYKKISQNLKMFLQDPITYIVNINECHLSSVDGKPHSLSCYDIYSLCNFSILFLRL